MKAFDRVLEEIRRERERLEDQNPTDQIWLITLVNAVGEIAGALIQSYETGSGDAFPMRRKLVRATAIAIQWLEKL